MSNPYRLFRQHLVILTFILIVVISSQSFADETTTAITDATQQPTETYVSIANKNYVLLQAEVARYELALSKPWPVIMQTHLYKLKNKDPNIALIRERLVTTGDLATDIPTIDNTIFDLALLHAVKNFQTRHGLKADGVIGQATLDELNVLPQDRIKELMLNMQRWAELSKRLGARFIMVNVPDYQLYLYEDGKQVLTMKAIVGKPDWQTPEISSKMSRIVFNPSWNVPVNIAAKDLLPKVKEDPYYLDDMHIKVYIRNGGRSEEINNQEIDWQRVDSDSPYDFRQEPGEDNALGLVKFEFPNPYDVYLHDTPAKTLFDDDKRALSHGCVRLERPMDLVAYLMKDDPSWSEERVEQTVGTRETTYVTIPRPIPIYITYITVWTDEAGVVNYRNDIYKRDI